MSDEMHLCETCRYTFALCGASRIVWGIDRHPEARGAEADKVLACNAYVKRDKAVGCETCVGAEDDVYPHDECSSCCRWPFQEGIAKEVTP